MDIVLVSFGKGIESSKWKNKLPPAWKHWFAFFFPSVVVVLLVMGHWTSTISCILHYSRYHTGSATTSHKSNSPKSFVRECTFFEISINQPMTGLPLANHITVSFIRNKKQFHTFQNNKAITNAMLTATYFALMSRWPVTHFSVSTGIDYFFQIK